MLSVCLVIQTQFDSRKVIIIYCISDQYVWVNNVIVIKISWLVKPVKHNLSSHSSVLTAVSPISKTELPKYYPVKFHRIRILPDSGILPDTSIQIRYIPTTVLANTKEDIIFTLPIILCKHAYYTCVSKRVPQACTSLHIL